MSDPWWRQAVVYQVYPRSFMDASGDGSGDLAGVILRLPYLADLGVDAIWLSPFYPSPQLDGGYDIVDPRDVDPMFGTLDDARALIEQAHAHGLRIIVDIVPNHFSTAHPWFQAAIAAGPGAPERERFHFRDGRGALQEEPPNNWTSIFGGPAWTRATEADGTAGQWYLNLFDSSQADLNWTHPDVAHDFLATLRFWLDLGVDGFRVDVAFGLAKDMTYADAMDPTALETERVRLDSTEPGEQEATHEQVFQSPYLDRDETLAYYAAWRELLDRYPGDRMAVGEAWLTPERARRYVAGDGLHQIFTFDFLATPWEADALRRVIAGTIDGLAPQLPAWAISNHDITRVVTRLGGGDIGLHRARALALLAHALPGSVYIYQGEELGLPDADIPPDRRQDPIWFRSGGEYPGRDGARVPLPWSGVAPPYGFGGMDTWLPQPADWTNLTVHSQDVDPDSTLALYRASLRLRRAHPGLANAGRCGLLELGAGIVAFERGHGFVSVTNCSAHPIDAPAGGEILLSSAPLTPDGRIPADTTTWIQATS